METVATPAVWTGSGRSNPHAQQGYSKNTAPEARQESSTPNRKPWQRSCIQEGVHLPVEERCFLLLSRLDLHLFQLNQRLELSLALLLSCSTDTTDVTSRTSQDGEVHLLKSPYAELRVTINRAGLQGMPGLRGIANKEHTCLVATLLIPCCCGGIGLRLDACEARKSTASTEGGGRAKDGGGGGGLQTCREDSGTS